MAAANTIRLHHVFKAPPERVYTAFLDPDTLVKWLSPHGFTTKIHELSAKVGGKHQMSFTNFNTGQNHSFGGTYLELVPRQKIRYTDKFDDPNLPGEITCTVTFKAVTGGTKLNVVQKNV